MVTWTQDELAKISAAEELELASVRRDETLGDPVTIWVVRVGDDLYVRSWKGAAGAWFRATQVHHAGHIEAGGVGKDVTFVAETDDDVNDRSTPRTAPSTAATADATSIRWWLRRREPQRSSSCRVPEPPDIVRPHAAIATTLSSSSPAITATDDHLRQDAE